MEDEDYLKRAGAKEAALDQQPNTLLGVFGEGTRLAMPKTRLRAALIVIEAWFRGY